MLDADGYGRLNYRGDLSGELSEGVVIGSDTTGRYLAVLDVEVEQCAECDPTVGYPGQVWQKAPSMDPETCPGCGGTSKRTAVFTRWATPIEVRKGLERAQLDQQAALRQAAHDVDALAGFIRCGLVSPLALGLVRA